MQAKYCYRFPHPSVTSDCVVFAFDGKELFVLLIERGNEPYKGYWAFPGGFMEIDEPAENTAVRELKEETGLSISKIQQLQAFSAVHRDPRERVVSIIFYSLMKFKDRNVSGCDDATKAQWFKINNLPKLAFDHDKAFIMIKHRLKTKLQFEPEDTEYHEDPFSSEEINKIISIL
ncbi:MAG: NUDIX hydrolase [Bacteroidales bacterium]|jgi:8-oxo-dGTP diphosphatase|nr:NUDIX hydrolase [Bacteroidales bacterium]